MQLDEARSDAHLRHVTRAGQVDGEFADRVRCWPAQKKDADLQPIQALRARLKLQCSSYFRTADELAVEMMTALRVLETTARAEWPDAVQEMVRAQGLGPSYLMNLRDKLHTLGDAAFIELQLGPTP